ncbi:Protein of unknown function [Gryllus bimaculatus]|nr:Protein of unknown function [Gryllus bimaculatus]
MYIDWENYSVMGIKTMKSFNRPRVSFTQRLRFASVRTLNISRKEWQLGFSSSSSLLLLLLLPLLRTCFPCARSSCLERWRAKPALAPLIHEASDCASVAAERSVCLGLPWESASCTGRWCRLPALLTFSARRYRSSTRTWGARSEGQRFLCDKAAAATASASAAANATAAAGADFGDPSHAGLSNARSVSVKYARPSAVSRTRAGGVERGGNGVPGLTAVAAGDT